MDAAWSILSAIEESQRAWVQGKVPRKVVETSWIVCSVCTQRGVEEDPFGIGPQCRSRIGKSWVLGLKSRELG